MSPKVARIISLAIGAVAVVSIATAIPVAMGARDADRATAAVIPEARLADIEQAIEEGGGCSNPSADPALAEAVDVYCMLEERAAAGDPFSTVGPLDPFAIGAAVIGLLWISTGMLIVTRRAGNLAGWAFETIGLAIVLVNTTQTLAVAGVTRPGSVPATGLWAIVNEYVFFAVALLPLLWLLYPDGEPPKPRWRMWIRVYVGALATAAAFTVLAPGPLNNLVEYGIVYLNPIGQPWLADLSGAIVAVAVVTMLGIAVASVVAVRGRFKRAQGEERQQLRWLRFVVTIAVILLLTQFVASLVFGLLLNNTVFDEGFNYIALALALTLLLGLPGAYLVAIFRHGLWDLDVVIRKTLIVAVVGVTLTAIGFGLLVMIPVVFLGAGGTTTIGNDLLPVIIGLVLGLLFGPVRRRARRFADRVVYGQRATPYEVLSSFGDRLSETYAADDVLPRMAQVLAQATGAEHAVVWLHIGDVLRPEARWPVDGPLVEPVTADDDGRSPGFTEVRHQGELLGALSVEMPANDPLDPAREQLVADLAAQAGLVLRNVRLIEELRASRQRLVAAQDEERRKLERNIHDGVQQQLVALSVQLRLAEQLTDRDPGRARDVLAGLQQQTTETLEDLRDLARGIYPPLLADQGLAAALESQARKAAVPTAVTAEGIGRYDRDVEATVYFCTLEAMNNVAKYAEASHAEIGLSQTDGTLEFLVRDDGRGFDVAAASTGTGLVGIADRLDALGGRLTIESEPGRGTALRGSLPVPHAG